MVIFHSYVSLPEGIPFSATQVRQVAVSSSRWSSGIGSSLEGPVAYKNSNAICDSEPICCWGISNIDIHHSCMCIYIYMYTYMLIPNKKELGHIFNQYSISGYISSESTFWIPRTTPASRSREVKLVAMQLPLADLTGSQIWRNGKFVLEKRTLTAKKDRRVGHQHFTRILLDLFGVCYPCIYIYIYVCIYIYHKA